MPMNTIKAVCRNPEKYEKSPLLSCFTSEEAQKARRFHSTIPGYCPTPLVSLPNLAKSLGTGAVYVKDESFRFGLNAFKSLGSSYCMGSLIADKLGADTDSMPFLRMGSDEVKEALGPLTFVTATDGNHGRGVAWSAKKLGQKSVVYMPEGTAKERLENIRALGAEAEILDMNYDGCVKYAAESALKNGWLLIQDTAWDGYEEIPLKIMQGYMTMALEVHLQLKKTRPTHIFLQAGVGSMAGAESAFFANLYPADEKPVIIIAEPHNAACIFKTAQADDGALHFTDGKMDTMMAGLACGRPCTLAWDILRCTADCFVSIPDETAAKGMRVLGNPLRGDERIISGESGAAGFGLAFEILDNEELLWLKKSLKIDESSRIVCFSTEGDTDRANYRKTVWDGYCGMPQKSQGKETS